MIGHVPECLCAACVPLGPAESRPTRCACVEAGGSLACSPEEQLLCGWRDVNPDDGDLVIEMEET